MEQPNKYKENTASDETASEKRKTMLHRIINLLLREEEPLSESFLIEMIQNSSENIGDQDRDKILRDIKSSKSVAISKDDNGHTMIEIKDEYRPTLSSLLSFYKDSD